MCGAVIGAGVLLPAASATTRAVTRGHAASAAARIHACANKKTGALRIAAKCKKTERVVTWSVVGPQGLQGAQGAQGSPGAQGSQGVQGPPGPATGAAGGALTGNYPNPSLNVSGGDNGSSACKNGEAITALTGLAALTCGPGVYTDSNRNTAGGDAALEFPASGSLNTAFGEAALAHNTTGSSNTGSGEGALDFNMTGSDNAAFGDSALDVISGNSNTALGSAAGANITSGTGNTFLGSFAGTNIGSGPASGNIEINNSGSSGDNDAIKIGTQGTQTSTLIAGINGASISGPTKLAVTNSSGLVGTGTTGSVALPSAVDGATSSSGIDLLINSSGVLGTTTSSRRFKTDIHAVTDSLERKLMALRPVTFHYKRQYIKGQPDPLEYGLIAEEVAKVLPNLVAYGTDGKPYTVRYQELPALLLAEIQRQQRQINAQQAEIHWLMKHIRTH
jgi:hypothetical protein